MPRSMPREGEVRREIYEAFDVWSRVSKIRLVESASLDADIQVSFQRMSHGDPYPFDGQASILAHAFGPAEHEVAGDIHFDDDEHWTQKQGDHRGNIGECTRP